MQYNKVRVVFWSMAIQANGALTQDHRGFLPVARTAVPAFASGGLPFAARAAGDATA